MHCYHYRINSLTAQSALDDNLLLINFETGIWYKLNTPARDFLFSLISENKTPSSTHTTEAESESGHSFTAFLLNGKIIQRTDNPLSYSKDQDKHYPQTGVFSFGDYVIEGFSDLSHVLKLKEVYFTDEKGWPLSDG